MEFVGTVMKKWGIIPVLFVMMIIIKRLIPVHGWGTLVVDIILCAVIGYGMVICLLEFKKAKIVIKTFIRKLKGVNADEYK